MTAEYYSSLTLVSGAAVYTNGRKFAAQIFFHCAQDIYVL